MSDRRHPPTPARLRKAARNGQSAYSPDLTTGASLLAAVAALTFLSAPLIQNLLRFAEQQWGAAGKRTDALVIDQGWIGRIALQTIPIMAVILLASWLTACGQRGWRWIAWRWQPGRLSPARNARAVAGNADLAVAGWGKSLALAAAAAWLIWREFPGLAALGSVGDPSTLSLALGLARVAGRLAAGMSLAIMAVGVLDLMWQHWRLRRQLMMTDEELREEQRQSGGH